MEETTSKNANPKLVGLERKSSIGDLKKKLGLDRVIHKPIVVKKDGKHLYYVAGYFYYLRWQTLERINIPNKRIICEVDREQWHRELDEAREKQDKIIDPELYPFGYEE